MNDTQNKALDQALSQLSLRPGSKGFMPPKQQTSTLLIQRNTRAVKSFIRNSSTGRKNSITGAEPPSDKHTIQLPKVTRQPESGPTTKQLQTVNLNHNESKQLLDKRYSRIKNIQQQQRSREVSALSDEVSPSNAPQKGKKPIIMNIRRGNSMRPLSQQKGTATNTTAAAATMSDSIALIVGSQSMTKLPPCQQHTSLSRPKAKQIQSKKKASLDQSANADLQKWQSSQRLPPRFSGQAASTANLQTTAGEGSQKQYKYSKTSILETISGPQSSNPRSFQMIHQNSLPQLKLASSKPLIPKAPQSLTLTRQQSLATVDAAKEIESPKVKEIEQVVEEAITEEKTKEICDLTMLEQAAVPRPPTQTSANEESNRAGSVEPDPNPNKPPRLLQSDATENLFFDDVGSCSGTSKVEFSFTGGPKQETLKPRRFGMQRSESQTNVENDYFKNNQEGDQQSRTPQITKVVQAKRTNLVRPTTPNLAAEQLKPSLKQRQRPVSHIKNRSQNQDAQFSFCQPATGSQQQLPRVSSSKLSRPVSVHNQLVKRNKLPECFLIDHNSPNVQLSRDRGSLKSLDPERLSQEKLPEHNIFKPQPPAAVEQKEKPPPSFAQPTTHYKQQIQAYPSPQIIEQTNSVADLQKQPQMPLHVPQPMQPQQWPNMHQMHQMHQAPHQHVMQAPATSYVQVDNSVNIHNHQMGLPSICPAAQYQTQQPAHYPPQAQYQTQQPSQYQQPAPAQQYIMTSQGYQPLPQFHYSTPSRLQNGQFHSLGLLQRKMMSYM